MKAANQYIDSKKILTVKIPFKGKTYSYYIMKWGKQFHIYPSHVSVIFTS